LPVPGKPLSAADPVAVRHVGGVSVPTTGAVGIGGCMGMLILSDIGDTQPAELVTEKL
jgi:hypothetical protein